METGVTGLTAECIDCYAYTDIGVGFEMETTGTCNFLSSAFTDYINCEGVCLSEGKDLASYIAGNCLSSGVPDLAYLKVWVAGEMKFNIDFRAKASGELSMSSDGNNIFLNPKTSGVELKNAPLNGASLNTACGKPDSSGSWAAPSGGCSTDAGHFPPASDWLLPGDGITITFGPFPIDINVRSPMFMQYFVNAKAEGTATGGAFMDSSMGVGVIFRNFDHQCEAGGSCASAKKSDGTALGTTCSGAGAEGDQQACFIEWNDAPKFRAGGSGPQVSFKGTVTARAQIIPIIQIALWKNLNPAGLLQLNVISSAFAEITAQVPGDCGANNLRLKLNSGLNFVKMWVRLHLKLVKDFTSPVPDFSLDLLSATSPVMPVMYKYEMGASLADNCLFKSGGCTSTQPMFDSCVALSELGKLASKAIKTLKKDVKAVVTLGANVVNNVVKFAMELDIPANTFTGGAADGFELVASFLRGANDAAAQLPDGKASLSRTVSITLPNGVSFVSGKKVTLKLGFDQGSYALDKLKVMRADGATASASAWQPVSGSDVSFANGIASITTGSFSLYTVVADDPSKTTAPAVAPAPATPNSPPASGTPPASGSPSSGGGGCGGGCIAGIVIPLVLVITVLAFVGDAYRRNQSVPMSVSGWRDYFRSLRGGGAGGEAGARGGASV